MEDKHIEEAKQETQCKIPFWKKKIVISNQKCLLGILFYMYLPVILFLTGWTLWYIAIPGIAVSVFACKEFIKDCGNRESSTEKEDFEISLLMVGAIVIFSAVIGYYLGWGGWCQQAGDWSKHNAVLRDLIERPWPVYYSNEAEKSMLTYYIGHYLLPAMVGKLLVSFRMAEITFYLWSVLGIVLILLQLFQIVSANTWKKQLGCMAAFIGFNGMMVVGQFVSQVIYPVLKDSPSNQWFDFVNLLQIRSNFVSLRWTTPNTICVWMVTLLLWKYRKQVKHYAVILLPSFLTGILSFMGAAMIAVIAALFEGGSCEEVCMQEETGEQHSKYPLFMNWKRDWKEWLKNIFSLSNLLTIGVLGSILFLYYSGNVFSEKPGNIGFSVASFKEMRLQYPLFCFWMFGCYSVLVWKNNKQNFVFWGANAVLLLLPLFKMGLWNDWLLNGATAGMFVIMIAVLEYICSHPVKVHPKTAILICILCIGCLNPAKEFVEQCYRTNKEGLQRMDTYGSLNSYANRSAGKAADLVYNYYTYDLESDPFYKYVARQRIEE